VKLSLQSGKLIERKSDEQDVFSVVNELWAHLLVRPAFRVRGSTVGDGSYVAVWSDTVPTGAGVYLKAVVIGVGTGNNAWYEIQAGVKNTAGVLAVIGATAVTVQREDAAAADARFSTSGTTVSLEVRDDAVNSMNWTADVSYMAAA
jgi:hypothetical protein